MSNTIKNQGKTVLAKLNRQLEALLDSNNSNSQIEIDLVKDNLRVLYDLIDVLNDKLDHKSIVTSKEVDIIDDEINNLLDIANTEFEKENEDIDIQIKEQEIALEEQNDNNDREPEIPKETEIIKVHDDINKELNKIENIEPIEPTIEETPIDRIEEKEMKGDISEKTVHILDVLPEDEEFEEDDSEEGTLIPSTIKLKPIKSLKTGIGINDKFMITNDLFEGSSKFFNSAINKLDSLQDTKEALYLLSDMKDENLWEIDDNVFNTFKKYIERRYTK